MGKFGRLKGKRKETRERKKGTSRQSRIGEDQLVKRVGPRARESASEDLHRDPRLLRI